LRANRLSKGMLVLLGNHAAVIDQSAELKKFHEAAPDDPLPLIGEARLAIRYGRLDRAKQLLNAVLAKAPQQIEAQAELGQLLLSEGDPEFGRWLAEAAPKAEAHPDVWMTRGLWAKQSGDVRGAARCFWETLRRDPVHQAAAYQLAQILQSSGASDSDYARQLADRAARLQRLCSVMDLLYINRDNLHLHRLAAELTESVGCVWEAAAWRQAILAIDPQDRASLANLRRLQSQLRTETPLVLDSENPAVRIDLSHFSLPRWDSELADSKAATPRLAKGGTRFADVAAAAGIDFRYYPAADHGEEARRIFQSTGGGVAVLDYDCDGWPDLYFTQGGRWPSEPGQTEYLDRLYRNRGDGTFEDVTSQCLLSEDRYSQGVAAGDFNNDGFTDLYVANIGANRLYMNQGDGTFRDVSLAAGIDCETWTTSCALADFNGDGLPDIYDVNYVQGPGVYERTCPQNGRPHSCGPTVFEAQPDRFYLNLGDGRFEDRTESAGLAVAGGNGLGVVAGDFDGSGKLSLFVANDQDANFFFINTTTAPGAAPQFTERGVLSGLAYDMDGKALACMGVAAGDANGDGRLDLFTTNFYQESNTLYLQEPGAMFADATAGSGLLAPSLLMLGFGAQFLDGDLDGRLDLVVTNGHVEDLSDQQTPYRMRPQYFRGLGGGKFAEVPPGELGEFFQGEYLGRGLARVDWNRDGREEFVVSHLGAPAALVANTSSESGHFLAVQLRGVKSARDAICAQVEVEVAGRRQTQWLLGGDGYHATNQRQLIFGLGDQERVEKLHVRWPSGSCQEFADLAVDQTLVLVEDSSRLTRLDLPR
ncbi:MAG TPA: FG-GAP-like repeat-containing protein, partial [Pirellulales bacterium]|nr:FG-GAP-like repeat-containing protein [Pirellulales bacterium]